MLIVFDVIGTFVFASSGAVLAGRARLDLFGAFVLAGAAGTAGGIIRDVLLGATPPAALSDWRYAGVACAATLVHALAPRLFALLKQPITVLDALGLGLFAATGTWRALDLDAPLVTAVVLGVLTGVGGGVVRDLLVARVPVVLRREVYALAAGAGSAVIILCEQFGAARPIAGVCAVAVTAALRLTASHRGWHLPEVGVETTVRP